MKNQAPPQRTTTAEVFYGDGVAGERLIKIEFGTKRSSEAPKTPTKTKMSHLSATRRYLNAAALTDDLAEKRRLLNEAADNLYPSEENLELHMDIMSQLNTVG